MVAPDRTRLAEIRERSAGMHPRAKINSAHEVWLTIVADRNLVIFGYLQLWVCFHLSLTAVDQYSPNVNSISSSTLSVGLQHLFVTIRFSVETRSGLLKTSRRPQSRNTKQQLQLNKTDKKQRIRLRPPSTTKVEKRPKLVVCKTIGPI